MLLTVKRFVLGDRSSRAACSGKGDDDVFKRFSWCMVDDELETFGSSACDMSPALLDRGMLRTGWLLHKHANTRRRKSVDFTN